MRIPPCLLVCESTYCNADSRENELSSPVQQEVQTVPETASPPGAATSITDSPKLL